MSIFDLPTYQDKPRAFQTVIPEADRDLARPKQSFVFSTAPIADLTGQPQFNEDMNQAADGNIIGIKTFFKYNPYGRKYTGNTDDIIDLQLISIITEFEQYVKSKTGTSIKILNGGSINQGEFQKALNVLKGGKEDSSKPAKERVGTTTVEHLDGKSTTKEESSVKDPMIAKFQKILGVEETGKIDADTVMAAEAVENNISKYTGKNADGMLLDQSSKTFKTSPDDLISAMDLMKRSKRVSAHSQMQSNELREFSRQVNSA